MRLQRNSLVMAVLSFPDVISEIACEFLIELFDHDSDNHEHINNSSRPTFTQLNINEHHSKLVPELVILFKNALELYKENVLSAQYLPEVEFLEEFRLKKYEVGGTDRFDEHVDVGDHESAKRALAMIFYLNDVADGGRTIFPYHDLNIQPKRGRVVVFPPTWEYPHIGEPPISTSKYIMSTYLHYQ